mmetsp:Transcript_5608/g.8209  ORF Transcript_5608/g.8209 Transcript_5608/m.8209 type:complete len:850 (-) Transcript_5608:156-2705(-)
MTEPESYESVEYVFNATTTVCLPRILTKDGIKRPLKSQDMGRVMDFDINPPAPPDGTLQYGEPKEAADADSPDVNTVASSCSFVVKHVALRGKFLFVMNEEDVTFPDANTNTHACVYEKNPPDVVVPLDRCVIETPPGGRRVFREHAMLAQGYEFVIRHTGPKFSLNKDENETPTTEADVTRLPVYFVASSLILRDEWVGALKVRSDYRGRTVLRVHDIKLVEASQSKEQQEHEAEQSKRSNRRIMLRSENTNKRNIMSSSFRKINKKSGSLNFKNNRDAKASGETVDEALQKFSSNYFSADQFVVDFFSGTDSQEDITVKTTELEEFQDALKGGLRSAVLEQYKYFVDASREISVMGHEVASLKMLVDEQNDLVNTMKGINFTGFVDVTEYDEGDSDENESDDNDDGHDDMDSVGSSVISSESSTSGGGRTSMAGSLNLYMPESKDTPYSRGSVRGVTPAVEIPIWLTEVTEEILAFLKECRYSDATNLALKAKSESADILGSAALTKAQSTELQQILQSVEQLIVLIGDRLVERLRRMNEALKQERKRERADPLSEQTPLLSPICLSDDILPLQLLVKLERYQDAASAYSIRRSLLLEEILLERNGYISSTSTVIDIEISVKQLSRSFFTALVEAIDGFLALFGNNEVPAGALASIIFWCDVELVKFAAAFGGNLILGRLALCPNKNNAAIQDMHSRNESLKDQRNQLKAAEEMGNFAAAATLRRKIALAEEKAKKQQKRQATRLQIIENAAAVSSSTPTASSNMDSRTPMSPEKDRQLAIKVAANCIDCTFQFASESLDSIGVPLAPRLAENIRPNLKGCEAEIAMLLKDKWNHVVFDWFSVPNKR